MRSPPSLPGLTPKSGVPDFGAFRITKVGDIRLWLQSIFLRKIERSPHEAQRNAGILDCASLHPTLAFFPIPILFLPLLQYDVGHQCQPP
jgi:hypothetical protein